MQQKENSASEVVLEQIHVFDIEMDDTDFNKLKQIFKDYDFEDYDSEEEEVSKTIRCIINYIEEEPESISI